VAAEGLSAGLAAAWEEGEAALCHAMLLVPDVHGSHPNEVKVSESHLSTSTRLERS
jgi:hypothetical protein